MEPPSSVLQLLPAPALVHALFTSAADALLLVETASLLLLDANQQAERLSRRGREELLRLPLGEQLRPDQGGEWLPKLQAGTLMEGLVDFHFHAAAPEEWVPVSLSVTPLELPGPRPAVLLALRDRRAQVADHRRLEHAEEELRRVLRSVSDCLWSCHVDPQGQWYYLYVSPVVERISGRPAAELMRKPGLWAASIDVQDLERWQDFAARVTVGRAEEIEYRLRRPDGNVVWVRESVVATPAEDRAGLLLHGILTDITERKQAEKAAVEKHVMESQKLESLGVLAGGIAHDFNNLLTGILGNAGLARLSCSEGSPLLRPLEQIETIALRASELCKQMLAYAGKTRPVVRALDLNALLRETRELLRLSVVGKPDIQFDLAQALPQVLADSGQLRQVVMNLVMNASEALGERGGTIRVATGMMPVGAGGSDPPQTTPDPFFLPAPALGAGNYVYLEVADNGPGIADDIKKRIFEPFFTTKFTGRGLGLAAVLGIVRSHKGAIEVASTLGQGTSFRVLLPPAPGE